MDVEYWISTLVFTPVNLMSMVVLVTASLVHLLLKLGQYDMVETSFHYKESALARYLLDTLDGGSSKSHFPMQAWCKSPHLQSVLWPFLATQAPVLFQREILSLNDHGLVSLDWASLGPRLYSTSRHMSHPNQRKVLKADNPVLLIVPGALFPNATSFSSTCFEALRRGFRPVVFNRRGWADTPLASPRLQTFGDPSDLRQVMMYLNAKYPRAKLCAVGVSSGGGLLLSYLGEYGSSSYLTVAVLVSTVWDAERSLLSNPQHAPSSIYHSLWLHRHKALFLRHAGVLQKTLCLERVLFYSPTLSKLEEHAYLPFSEEPDLQSYWEANNPVRDVDEISVPLLAIHSRDDPVISVQNIPTELFNVYPNLFLVLTDKGGHCGFLKSMGDPCWWVGLALDYMRCVHRFTSSETKAQGIPRRLLVKSSSESSSRRSRKQ